MAALANLMPLALEGQWRGWAAAALVLTAVAVFMGTPYILLASNFGMRKAFHILMVSLAGFFMLLSALWLFGAPGTVPGTGPRYSEPRWIPFLAGSAQGTEFNREIEEFPDAWDKIGKKYSGGIDSNGEFLTAKTALIDDLVILARFQGLPAVEAKDWEFRASEVKPAPGEEETPEATVRYRQAGGTLLFGVTIPASGKHREFTVFALRDKGKVFLWAAVFLGASVVIFVLGVLALARIERREKRLEGAPAGREPARV